MSVTGMETSARSQVATASQSMLHITPFLMKPMKPTRFGICRGLLWSGPRPPRPLVLLADISKAGGGERGQPAVRPSEPTLIEGATMAVLMRSQL